MDWIITILIGALIGWLASIVMKTNAQQGALTNVLMGMVGASLARWLFGGVLGVGGSAAGSLTLMSLIWGVIGAVILIFVLRTLRVLR